MTNPAFTNTAVIVWSRTFGFQGSQLIPSPGWNPTLTDGLDADLHTYQFTNDDFGTAVTIMVFLFDDSRCTAEGYLIPADGPCPLCADLRRIFVRVDMRDSAAFATETLDTLLTDGVDAIKDIGIVEMTKPCPACRTPEHLLAATEHIPEADY
jgi:hypothetical protein